jgi:hypothetical protein
MACSNDLSTTAPARFQVFHHKNDCSVEALKCARIRPRVCRAMAGPELGFVRSPIRRSSFVHHGHMSSPRSRGWCRSTSRGPAIDLPTPCRHEGFLGIRGGPYSGGRRVPENGFFTSGNRSGSGTSQSMQRNLRPPVFTSTKCMGLWHFRQEGGGGFLGMWTLTLDQAGAQHSQSPGTAEDGAGDDLLCAVRAS